MNGIYEEMQGRETPHTNYYYVLCTVESTLYNFLGLVFPQSRI